MPWARLSAFIAVLVLGGLLSWIAFRGLEPSISTATNTRNLQPAETHPLSSLAEEKDWSREYSLDSPADVGHQFGKHPLPSSEGTFVVEGRVLVGSPTEVNDEIHVLCEAQQGNTRHPIATISVSSETGWSFGPLSLPLLAADQYRFQLEGPNIIPDVLFLGSPNKDARMWVELEAKAGIDVWMIVADENEVPLPNAEGVVAWFSGGGMRMERRARPREDGLICVRGCPPGILYLEGHCPGYSFGRLDPLELPEEPSYTRRITLSRAAMVRGRCTLRGEPIENFEVSFWLTRFPDYKDRRSFTEREEGSFEIDVVPYGEVAFLATTATHVNLAAKIVDVSQEITPEVELEVCEPLRGVGTVMDLKTKEPILTAEVQAYASGGHGSMGFGMIPWGPPQKVGADGSFDFRAFAPGHTALRVWAPNYSVTTAEVQNASDGVVDFGMIAIPGKQPLVVRLISDEPFDPSLYAFAAIGPEKTADQPFPQSGILTIPAISAGNYAFYVFFGETEMIRQARTLLPGEDWVLEFPAGGFCRVHIEVVSEQGKDLPANHYVGYRRDISGTDMVRSVPLPQDGKVELDGLMPGDVGLSVHDTDGNIVANQALSITSGDKELSVQIHLFEVRRKVRVVGSGGEAVEGAYVVMRPNTSQSWTSDYTDARGECTIAALSPGTYRVNLYHQTLGTRADIPLELSAGSDEVIELTLDTSRLVVVQLVQQGVPQVGVPVRLYGEDGSWELARRGSDAEGIVFFRSLGEGRYLVRILDPYWPADHVLEATADPIPRQIEVYGLADVEFQVLGAGGLPVAGQTIELFSVFFDKDVGEWIEAALVQGPKDGLVTDVRGLLRLQGLPRGDYQWRLPRPDGAIAGITTAVSGQLIRALVMVP